MDRSYCNISSIRQSFFNSKSNDTKYATAATIMYFDDIKLANVIVSGPGSRSSNPVIQTEVDAS
jgi:hypothetical protein